MIVQNCYQVPHNSTRIASLPGILQTLISVTITIVNATKPVVLLAVHGTANLALVPLKGKDLTQVKIYQVTTIVLSW